MSILQPPDDNFRVFLWDILTNILFLSGVLVIERFLRPMFGTTGPPLMTNIIMTISELTLALALLTQLVDQLWDFVRSLLRIRELQIGIAKFASREGDDDND